MYQRPKLRFYFCSQSYLQPTEDCKKLFSIVSLDLLRLLTSIQKLVVEDVGVFFLRRQPFEAWMRREMLNHPFVKVFDIRHSVKQSLNKCERIRKDLCNLCNFKSFSYSFCQHISVFAQQTRVDDSPLMLRSLEVWIGIQEKHFRELTLVKVVCEEFHRVGSDTSDVPILPRVQLTQHSNAILNVVTDLHTDLHSYRNFVGKSLAEAYEESSITAAN